MRTRLNVALLVCGALSTTTFAQQSFAVDPAATRLVKFAIQDEVDQLPADNMAYFSAAKKVKVKLDLLAAMQNESAELTNALVTVVRPSGKSENYTPDSDGMITIENVEKGVHAVVASSDRVHGTMPFFFDEEPNNDAAANDPLALANEAAPVQLTMLKIKDTELRKAVDRVRDVEGSDMSRLASVGPIGERYTYRVKLSADGTLYGRVILVGKDNGLSPADVNITIYFKGNPIGSTVSDSSGNFRMAGVQPGVHGLVASGRPGYAAFAFEAIEMANVASISSNGETLVSFASEATDKVPVVLVPPELTPGCVEAITTYYPSMNDPLNPTADPIVGDPIGPVGNGFSPAPFGGTPYSSGFSGGGGGGGPVGFGGGGGFAALAPLLILPALLNPDDDNNVVITPMQPASQSQPNN